MAHPDGMPHAPYSGGMPSAPCGEARKPWFSAGDEELLPDSQQQPASLDAKNATVAAQATDAKFHQLLKQLAGTYASRIGDLEAAIAHLHCQGASPQDGSRIPDLSDSSTNAARPLTFCHGDAETVAIAESSMQMERQVSVHSAGSESRRRPTTHSTCTSGSSASVTFSALPDVIQPAEDCRRCGSGLKDEDHEQKAIRLQTLSEKSSSYTKFDSRGQCNVPQAMQAIDKALERYRPQWLQRLEQHRWFEMGFAIVIMLNAVTMAVDVQYDGIQVGYDLQYPGSANAADEAWPHAKTLLAGSDWIFGLLFLAEVMVKLSALCIKFFFDVWNWLDASVCILFVMEKGSAHSMQISPSSIKILRLARLVRLVRLVKTLKSFDALFLLSTAIKGSVSILGWALALLMLLQLTLAILISQLLHATYFNDSSHSMEDRHELFGYFGTMSRALFSTLEMTLADFPKVCRLLSENVSEYFMGFYLVLKLVIGFAVIGVVNGVFMQETLKIAASDPDIMVRQKRQAKKLHGENMRSLFEYLDVSNDGAIDWEEFQILSESELVKTWFSSMDLEPADLPALFLYLDKDGSRSITMDELINGVAQMKGPAKATDMMRLMRILKDRSNGKDHRDTIAELSENTNRFLKQSSFISVNAFAQGSEDE